MPGGVFQHLGVRVEKQHVGRVHAQLAHRLIEEDVEGDAHVQAGGDGQVNSAQGLHQLQAVFGLIVQRGSMAGAAGHLGDGGEQALLLFGWLTMKAVGEMH